MSEPIGITVGDPAGIGPEVVESAIRETGVQNVLCFGPSNVVEPLSENLGVDHVATGGAFDAPRGKATRASGQAALDALMTAIEYARDDRIAALCTAPISKEALHLAGSQDRGHTEILARELGVGPTAMAFFGDRLRTALVSAHVPLAHAIETLSHDRIVEVTRLLRTALSQLDGAEPRLALAALNPHAGEAGLLGHEEVELLAPAVIALRAEGLDVHGPLPADSVYRRTLDGEFDGVVSLYHDQALIPLKILGFGESTNITLGLRIPRTSPDHGTAYDRVGCDDIRAEGMIAALRWAERLVAQRG